MNELTAEVRRRLAQAGAKELVKLNAALRSAGCPIITMNTESLIVLAGYVEGVRQSGG